MAPKSSLPLPARRLPSALAVVSEIVPETAQACWEIRGFSLMDKKKDKCVESPPLVEAAGARFGIMAYWGGYKDAQAGQFSLYCVRMGDDAGKSVVLATYAITLVGRGTTMCHEDEDSFEFKPKGNRGWPNFGKLDTLMTPQYLVNDSLVIELRVSARLPGRESVRKFPAAPGSTGRCGPIGVAENKGTSLAGDWSEFLSSGQASDVEVSGSLSDGEVVKAHRLVLAARSPVFNRMLLESCMRESRDAKVLLEGVDHEVVEKFVRFLYTDELDSSSLESPDTLCHLLALGHRYEVQSLMRLCSAHLTVTEADAIERLMMAEQLGIASLKEQVMDYICSCRQRLAKVQKTEAFTRLSRSYPQLMCELFAQVTKPATKRSRGSADSA